MYIALFWVYPVDYMDKYEGFCWCVCVCVCVCLCVYVDCEYGDRSDWCTTLRPSYCYTDSHQCCQSCAELFNHSSGGALFA